MVSRGAFAFFPKAQATELLQILLVRGRPPEVSSPGDRRVERLTPLGCSAGGRTLHTLQRTTQGKSAHGDSGPMVNMRSLTCANAKDPLLGSGFAVRPVLNMRTLQGVAARGIAALCVGVERSVLARSMGVIAYTHDIPPATKEGKLPGGCHRFTPFILPIPAVEF